MTSEPVNWQESGAFDQAHLIYAGFWLWVAASLIDALGLGLPALVILLVTTVVLKIAAGTGTDPAVAILAVWPSVLIFGTWLYFALMESSAWQATLGKKILGFYVTDMNGQRLGVRRALGRTLAQYLSA
jgi:uncharacterized RDD family membrane protein YckC